MKDQIDQLQSKGIAAVRLDSSLPWDEYRSAMDQIRSGTAKILYVAPERFFNERFRSSLDGVKISLFAIDEAHCISQWGHNFRPDYLKLAALSQKLNVERVLALTATATARRSSMCRCRRRRRKSQPRVSRQDWRPKPTTQEWSPKTGGRFRSGS